MATKRDYYDVLGISKNASNEEIKKAYRQLAKKYHPDVSQDKDAEAKFKEVQEAYDILSDPQKKSTYDQFGHEAANGSNPFGGGFGNFSGFEGGFADIFSDLFGTRNKYQRRGDDNRGDDLQKSMTIEFMEAALGTTKHVEVKVNVDCKDCGGTGAQSPSDIHVCDRCHGNGYVYVDQRSFFGTMRTQQVCPKCGGMGETITNKCKTCNGHGRVSETKKVEVKIPAGVDNGMTLRVPGYGDGGKRGAENGDLYITFEVKPHKIFIRRGIDILLNVPITFAQAALGATVEVPTIYGKVDLKIPAGIQSGTSLRLKDKGIQKIKSNKKGDQFVIVELQTPKNLTPEERKLFEQLENTEAPRKKTAWEKFKEFFTS